MLWDYNPTSSSKPVRLVWAGPGSSQHSHAPLSPPFSVGTMRAKRLPAKIVDKLWPLPGIHFPPIFQVSASSLLYKGGFHHLSPKWAHVLPLCTPHIPHWALCRYSVSIGALSALCSVYLEASLSPAHFPTRMSLWCIQKLCLSTPSYPSIMPRA